MLVIKEGYLILTNKFIFSFQNESFNVASGDFSTKLNVGVDLSIGRYVSGEITLEDYSEPEPKKDKQTCLILPLEKPNNVFY